MRPALYASLCLSLMACAQGVSQEDHDALAARVATLERAADVPTPMSEEEAMALYQQLDAATQAMDWDKARALLDKAKAEAGHTRVASRFARVAEEIAVIGKHGKFSLRPRGVHNFHMLGVVGINDPELERDLAGVKRDQRLPRIGGKRVSVELERHAFLLCV